jgi:hypothetical protein
LKARKKSVEVALWQFPPKEGGADKSIAFIRTSRSAVRLPVHP